MSKIYYNQMDARWKNHPYTAPGYPNATTGSSGCGPTCAAMVVSSCREIVTPDIMCDISKQNGYRVSGGTDANLFEYVANRWGIEFKRVRSSYEAHQACKEGWFVVINCGSGLWTTGGHYILAVGASEDAIEIYDPYLYSGKFDRPDRAGKVDLIGNSAWVQIDTFKANSEARAFYCFKIDESVPTPTPTGYGAGSYEVTTDTLRVRSEPTTNSRIVTRLHRGSKQGVDYTQGNWRTFNE